MLDEPDVQGLDATVESFERVSGVERLEGWTLRSRPALSTGTETAEVLGTEKCRSGWVSEPASRRSWALWVMRVPLAGRAHAV
jgi:hypothetical protein